MIKSTAIISLLFLSIPFVLSVTRLEKLQQSLQAQHGKSSFGMECCKAQGMPALKKNKCHPPEYHVHPFACKKKKTKGKVLSFFENRNVLTVITGEFFATLWDLLTIDSKNRADGLRKVVTFSMLDGNDAPSFEELWSAGDVRELLAKLWRDKLDSLVKPDETETDYTDQKLPYEAAIGLLDAVPQDSKVVLFIPPEGTSSESEDGVHGKPYADLVREAIEDLPDDAAVISVVCGDEEIPMSFKVFASIDGTEAFSVYDWEGVQWDLFQKLIYGGSKDQIEGGQEELRILKDELYPQMKAWLGENNGVQRSNSLTEY